MQNLTKAIFSSQEEQNIEYERLKSLINSMGDGVVAIDEQQKIVMYNGAALNIIDRNETISNQYISAVLHLINKNNQTVDISQLINNSLTANFSRDYSLLYSDGSKINLYLSIAPVRLGYGKNGMRGHILLLRDITKEKSLEEERDEFISVVSHELRTPIAIAEGNISNAQAIAEPDVDINKIKDSLEQAHDQILFLSEMINDLSTLSRAERGTLKVEIEPINISELLINLKKLYNAQIEKKNLVMNIELDPALELLHSSKLYVREILQNIITNAIKYTNKGSVTISAKKADKSVILSVHDTGVGISKSDQEKVFDKFFRSEDYHTKNTKGTGLGLYVTLKLARLIHANITVDSTLNKGSTFKIVIPDLN